MPRFNDLKGQKFGRLTVIKRDESRLIGGKKRTYWLCKCECGNIVSVRADQLGKDSNSCGCLKVEQDKINLSKYTAGKPTTGKSHTRLATIWYHILSRCNNPKDDRYKDYGARGIKVCDAWANDFSEFEAWALQSGYSDNLTIDRIDVNGDYTPTNCRWATNKEQRSNKQSTLWMSYNGHFYSLMELYRILSPTVSYQTVKTRYHKGERDINKLFAGRQYRDNLKE